MEIVAQEQEREIDQWRRTRWLGALVANVAGNKKEPQELLKLPGDKSTKIDIDTLKKLSGKHGKV